MAPLMSSSVRIGQATTTAVALFFGLLVVRFAAAAVATSSSLFVNSDGFLIDAPLRLQSIPDVGAYLTSLSSVVSSHSALLAQHAVTISAQQATIAYQQEEIDALKNRTASLELNLTSLADRVAQDETTAATVAIAVDVQAAEITALQSSNRSVQAAAIAVTARVTAAESTILSHTAEIASLQTSNATVFATISSIQSAAIALATRVTAAEATIVTHTTKIASLQSSNSTVFLTLAADAKLLANHTGEISLIEAIESPHIVGDASSGLNTTFLNGWGPGDSSAVGARYPKFWKDRGVVHLEGLVSISSTYTASQMYTVTETAPSGGGTVTYTVVDNGLASSVLALFQLPVGYRPNQTETAGAGRMYTVDGNEQSCVIGISYDGYVMLRHGKTTNTWIGLDGITFRVGG